MKLLKYNLGILLCLTAIFFIACDSDDETIQQNPKPTIKFTKVGDEQLEKAAEVFKEYFTTVVVN